MKLVWCVPMMPAIPRPGRSVHDDTNHLDAHPERVELVAASLAEVVVTVAAALVVEADPEFLVVLRHLDFQRPARR